MPLIATQAIIVYIWTCRIYLNIGTYGEITTLQPLFKGGPFKKGFTRSLLGNSINLEAVSLFLYTW